ncbi:MAG: Tn3 family transposase [Devosia sp.]|nr:Tn3 family transposase [Devosia sp.]
MTGPIVRKPGLRASGLNVVVSTIVHWNAVQVERAVIHLRKMHREIPDYFLKHISPLRWEHQSDRHLHL